MRLEFKPLPPKAKMRRPELFQPPAHLEQDADLFSKLGIDLAGFGMLYQIVKMARSFMIEPRQRGGGNSAAVNINPKKRLNPKTSFQPS